jgi:UDP-N-acetylglucosamine 1-carboxyvinyltransferase
MMAAALLTRDKVVLHNVPQLTDVDTMTLILLQLGVRVAWRDDHVLEIQSMNEQFTEAPLDLARDMRASICLLGPLLARRKRAHLAMPGGCTIGDRPVDLHLKGMRALGARVKTSDLDIVAEAEELRGCEVYLGGLYGSTVLGTCNVLMAAALARGVTVIDDAACEPEVQELCHMLNCMGARVSGIGSKRLAIEGVQELHGVECTVIPDRIEAATFLAAGAITRGDVLLKGLRRDHLGAVLDALKRMAVKVVPEGEDGLRVAAPDKVQSTDIATTPYPGLPTDAQAQLMAVLCVADGVSVVTERVFPDRFMHVAELNRLGADIRKQNATAIVLGVPALKGAQVTASDLRASAALIVGGLAASGVTTIHGVKHLDRGYERIERRLESLGARIRRIYYDERSPLPPSISQAGV